MSPNPSKVDIIQAILTNQSLTDNEKTLLIDEFINEIKREYPDLKYHATKADVTDTQLQLTKEIKELDLKISKEISDTKKEIKDLDFKLTKEIKDLDAKLTKEIKELDFKLTKEIKDLDVKLTKEIKDLDVKLTKEIAETHKEIKNLDLKLADTKTDIIKWVAGMLFVQIIAITGIFFTAFKLFMPV